MMSSKAPTAFVPTTALSAVSSSSFTATSTSPSSASSPFARAASLKLHARPAAAARRATIVAEKEDIPDQLTWVDALPVEDNVPGEAKRAIVRNLDICFACSYDGQVFAVGNKSPPLGLPTSDGIVVEEDGEAYIMCSQYGTLFDLKTGEVKDEKSWIPKPPVISNVLRAIFKDRDGLPTYPVRERDGMIQVLVNENARAQYEQKYWKGILDASGKSDGGYY